MIARRMVYLTLLLVQGQIAAPTFAQEQEPPAIVEGIESDVDYLQGLETFSMGSPAHLRIAEQEQARIRRQLAEVRRRLLISMKRVETAGMSSSTGSILRRDSEWLPEAVDLRRLRSEAQMDLATTQIARYDLVDWMTASLGDARSPEALLRSFGGESESRFEELFGMRDRLAKERLEELEKVIAVKTRSLELVRELELAVVDYRNFIDENVLWIRSSNQTVAEWFAAIGTDSLRIIRSFAEFSVSRAWSESTPGRRFAWLFGVAFATALVLRRKVLLVKRMEWNACIRHVRTDHFRKTIFALGAAVCLALPLPLFLWVFGGIVQDSGDATTWAIGAQLQSVAKAWLLFRVITRALEPAGLVPIHFHWHPGTSGRLIAEMRWSEPVWLAGMLIAFPAQAGSLSETLGRLGCMIIFTALALFTFRVLRAFPAKDPAQSETTITLRWRPLWRVLGVGVPLALCVAAFLGFVFTVERFLVLFASTFLLMAVLLLVQGLLYRWLAVARRQLALAQALEARAARASADERSELGVSGDFASQEMDHVDIPTVDAQTRRLFRSALTLTTIIGLFLLWRGIFPALSNLNDFEVWPTFGGAANQVAEEGAPSSERSDRVSLPLLARDGLTEGEVAMASTAAAANPLSLGEILLAAVALIVTLLFARNLPALLELTLLQRLPLDGGTRYAATTLIRYFVLLVGLGSTFHVIGVGWNQLQWLAAALTFGLAFGLQEIFANFVSGLIILFERPIRVGDIVTVGDSEGKVMQLRMRATTIQDYDRREMLVPNKEFITQRVINWTLTDPVTRIIVPVGIAYGSDTDSVRRALLECAREEPLVLGDPEPVAIFRGFGESSLDFQLRVFIGNREYWAEIVDRLHEAIDDAFRKLGIVIAFPQRDVHIHALKNDPPPQGDGS
ncbi:MAG: mechanosensitive ion channel domain-containing protein [Planctomycetota bacterium]